MNKIIFIILISICLLTVNACSAVDIKNNSVRVLISNKGSFEHNVLRINAEGSFYVFANEELLFRSNIPFDITTENDYFVINHDGIIDKVLKTNKITVGTDNTPIIIENISKKGTNARYQGKIEISESKNGKLRLVNIIDTENYLKGVVPNEMPVYFGLEALKAQAIAARGYIYRDTVAKNSGFDVYDTTASQVYNGFNSRHATSDKAVDETIGQFATYKEKIILSLYHSTSGGHTENYENVFSNDSAVVKFPSNPVPYLVGVSDVNNKKDLSDNKNAEEYYTTSPESFDIKSPLYRWEYIWSREELENILKNNLKKYTNSPFVKSTIKDFNDLGDIENIEVLKRGVSGKAMFVKVTTSKGAVYIAKEIVIRRIFQYKNKWLPSANVVFTMIQDDKHKKKIAQIKVNGGGYGHGVGMSQFGAGYMGTHGYKYPDILKHYYKGIAISTRPMECKFSNIQNCKQTFFTQDKDVKLVVHFSTHAHELVFDINGKKVMVTSENIKGKDGEINLSRWIQKGINTIQLVDYSSKIFDFVPHGVKFYVEISGSNEEK